MREIRRAGTQAAAAQGAGINAVKLSAARASSRSAAKGGLTAWLLIRPTRSAAPARLSRAARAGAALRAQQGQTGKPVSTWHSWSPAAATVGLPHSEQGPSTGSG